jgi:hypothetical protein
VQQAQESAAKAEAQGIGRFRREVKTAVVELQAVHRVAQLVVLRRAAGIKIAVDHLLDRLVARQRLRPGLGSASVTVSPMRTSCRSLMAATKKPTSPVPMRSTCLGRGISLPRSVIW